MPVSLVNLQYCYDYLIDQISLELLLYAHVPTAFIAVLFAFFLFYNARTIASNALIVVCLGFAMWSLLNIGSWFAFLGAEKMMLFWSLVDMLALLFFFFSYYFLYSFIVGKDLPFWQKVVGVLVLLPTIIFTFLGHNLTIYDSGICEAWENNAISLYPYYVEGLFLLASIVLVIKQYVQDKRNRKMILLAGLGVILFLTFFFSATLAVNLLVDYSIVEYAYNFEIYGMFGMPLLLGFLSFLIVRYHAFNIKLIGAQALIVALIILIGSQFLFIEGSTTKILTGITLALTGIIGINLIRSVKREVEQREKIEKLAIDLEKANVRLKELDTLKSEFLSFASHQLRSPLTAIHGYTSMLLEGDFGEVPEKIKPTIETLDKSSTSLIKIVNDFLNISRIEQGRMQYEFSQFDLKELVEEVIAEQRPNVEARGLAFSFTPEPASSYTVNADRGKLKQVIGNILDNSIKYTPAGSVQVTLNRKDAVATIAIADTGVGIDAEEIPKLFSKFSRAKDASKTNVTGTGLGLYVAKQMIEAQKGRIWVESKGKGMGSTFFIEFEAK